MHKLDAPTNVNEGSGDESSPLRQLKSTESSSKSSSSDEGIKNSKDCARSKKTKDTKCGGDILLWTNGGGGWRTMAAGMGTAQLLAKIGIIKKRSSKLDAISGNSGGAWFVQQFMYSEKFF